MEKLKIIYISYDGMTDPLGQSQVLPYLVGLSELGFQIHLISFEKEERFNQKQDLIKKIVAPVDIVWHPLMYHAKPPVISTLIDIRQAQLKVKEILKKHKVSLVHCRSYISALIGLSLKRKKGIPFLFDMRGFWADERIDGNIWSLKNPVFKTIYNYFKRKEKEFILESDYIVSLTHNAKQEILSWNLNKAQKPKIMVIPCCADFNHFSQSNINNNNLVTWKKNLGIEEQDFVISYVGSLGTWYMIDEMIAFFSVALKKIPHCKFLLITADNPDIALNAAQKYNIPASCIIIKKAERSEVPYLISLSKFSVFFIKPSYSKKASSPTKLAEILGMGIPVICNNQVGDVAQIVEEGKVGFVLQHFNDEAYERALMQMLTYLKNIQSNNIVNYAHQYASLEEGVKRYHQVYQSILNPIHDDKILP